MPEHRIRLRGGWDCHYRAGDDDDSPEVLRRLDLPAANLHDWPRRLRLTRQFGRPPVDLAIEEVFLELRNIPGLKKARLNGRELVVASVDWELLSVPIGEPLLPRNGLMLEVELDPQAALATGWGDIALVIRPRG